LKKPTNLGKSVEPGVAIGKAIGVTLNNIAIGVGFVFAAASIKNRKITVLNK
jgi:Ca2+/Na+ antiporter